MRMTMKRTCSTRDWGLLFIAIVTALMIAIAAMPSISRADFWEGKLPGKSWTTNGHVFALTAITGAVLSGPAAICVGPVSESSTFPYGWDCSENQVSWGFPAIWAAPGVDNPNSSEDKYEAWAS